MKVYLVGYMGVGKSTIGKKLASRIGVPFCDLDSLIESELKMNVAEVFSKKGEPFFRSVEKRILKRLIFNGDEFVLATGGGAVMAEGMMDMLIESGLVVWLKMSPKMLANRLEQAARTRPLLDGVANYEAFVSVHLQNRIPFYSKAQIHYAASQNNSEQLSLLANEILNYSR